MAGNQAASGERSEGLGSLSYSGNLLGDRHHRGVPMDGDIGLEAHASSCTVAILGPSGRRLGSHDVEINAQSLISTIEAIPRQCRLCVEEGVLAGWRHEVLAPHVQEIVVTAVPQNRGPESDKLDAFALAEMLRVGSIPRRVSWQRRHFRGGPGPSTDP